MGQILVRQLDDAAIARLKMRAKAQGTSVEALAREAIQRAAALSGAEKLELARQMRSEFQALVVPGVEQTPGWVLIREGRDER
jgi:plasmid stability protein